MLRARRLWALLLFALLLRPVASLAALDATDVVQIQATTSLLWDSNLFRLPDNRPDKQSDNARILGIGLKADKLLSRQRLIADVNLNEIVYDKNDSLDHFGGDGRLAWMWQFGNHWSGEASYRKRRQLAGFEDLQRLVQDLVDTDTYTLTGGYQFHPRWRASAEVREIDVTHSAVNRTSLDFNARIVGAEILYQTPKQTSVRVQARRTDRTYPARTSVGGHRETRFSTLAIWPTTETTRLDARIGHVDVQHDQSSLRNFSGVTWRAGATWDTTSKLRLGVRGSKDIRLYENIETSYIVEHEVGFDPTYAVTSKIVLQGTLSYAKREFLGDPGFIVQNFNREDNVRIGRVGLVYSPIRNIDLSLSYETGERKSNRQGLSFDYQSWLGTVRIGF